MAFRRIKARPLNDPSRILEAALAISFQLPGIETFYPEATLNAAASQFSHGLGLRELLDHGVSSRGLWCRREDLREVLAINFNRDHPANLLAAASTISVPGILSNVANKLIYSAFMGVDGSWSSVATPRNVKDFKQVQAYSLTGDTKYEKVGDAGELKHGTLGEASYTNQANTYGKILSITRRDLVNDDSGAFLNLAKRLGRGAALALSEIFWRAFLAGVGSFWTGPQGNLITGAGTVLSLAGLDAATVAFAKLQDPDGNPIGSTPEILLVPSELSVTASTLMSSTMVNTGGASTDSAVPNINVFRSKYKVVSPPYLSNSSYTGNSATAWYLLANPNDIPTIEIAFLDGNESPTVEISPGSFQTLSIDFRGYHDFGVALAEYRGSVRAAGA